MLTFSTYFAVTLIYTASVLGAAVDFMPRQSCSTLHHVHAPGTFEEGLGGLGEPISLMLEDVIPGTTSYGVPYNTSVFDGTLAYNRTIEEGGNLTAQHLRDQVDLCPDQQFVLSGASKGAVVMHSTNLATEIKSKVLAVIVFGDPSRSIPGADSWPIDSPSVNLSPRNRTSTTENVVSFCNTGDTICEGGKVDPNALPLPHFTYAQDGSLQFIANGRKNPRDRDMHGRVVLLTGAFTPLGLTLMQELAQRGAQIIALTPSLVDPTVEGLVTAVREVTSNELIYAEECDITSPASIRAFCKQFLATTPSGPSSSVPGAPKDPPRLDAIVLTHEYTHVGAGWGANKTMRAMEENTRLEGGLASFLLITLLLPCLIRATSDRDIRIINVVNPLYAASVPTYIPPISTPKPSEMKDGVSNQPQPPAEDPVAPEPVEPKGSFQAQLENLALASVSSLEGHRSLRSILLVRHLQRVLDALAAQSDKPVLGTNKEVDVISVKKYASSNITAVTVAPGFSRVQTVGPYLRARKDSEGYSSIGFLIYTLFYPVICLFAKHSMGAAQTVLYTLFAPALRSKVSEAEPKAKDDVRDDTKAEVIPRIQGGLLYRECAPTQLPGRGVALFETEGIGRAVWEEMERGVEIWEKSEGEVLKELAREVEKEGKETKGKGKETAKNK